MNPSAFLTRDIGAFVVGFRRKTDGPRRFSVGFRRLAVGFRTYTVRNPTAMRRGPTANRRKPSVLRRNPTATHRKPTVHTSKSISEPSSDDCHLIPRHQFRGTYRFAARRRSHAPKRQVPPRSLVTRGHRQIFSYCELYHFSAALALSASKACTASEPLADPFSPLSESQ